MNIIDNLKHRLTRSAAAQAVRSGDMSGITVNPAGLAPRPSAEKSKAPATPSAPPAKQQSGFTRSPLFTRAAAQKQIADLKAENERLSALAAAKKTKPVAKKSPTVARHTPTVKSKTARPAASNAAARLLSAPPKKPDSSHLRALDRTVSEMTHETKMKEWATAEATRQVEREEQTVEKDPTAGKPVTAASIAAEMLRQQQEASKPKIRPWSAEAAARRKKIDSIAADLIKQHSPS